jgi:uncharacterized protein YbjT (DUF2867 family)
MTTILVTGGTGTLGRPTVERLRAAGHDVRILSRKPGPGRVVGDLTSGTGLAAAANGVDVIVHLATSQGRRDIDQTRHLLSAMPTTTHLIAMSIVGVDQIPLPYYRTKLAAENLIASSGVPYTILRATQFHDLVDRVFRTERFLPVLLAPAFSLQPIAVEDVAVRLTELAGQPALKGRAPDVGGPERLPATELARLWKQARGVRRRVLPLRVPGRIFGTFAAGRAMVDGPAYGKRTFAEYLR